MIKINLYKGVMLMSEDKKHMVDPNEETKFVDLEGVCASGIIDPLLARPLWQGHRYAKLENWEGLYCPTHRIIYDRIQKMNRLNEKS